jgi:molecular chaperone HtpG
LVKNTKDNYFTFEEYREQIKTNQTDKSETVVALYTTDPSKQHTYIESAEKRGYDVLVMNHILDNHFINNIEHKLEKVTFKRVDSESLDKLIDKDQKTESVLTEDQKNKVKEIFEKAVSNKSMTLQIESLPPDELPVSITLPEFMRRMKDMSALGGGFGMNNMPDMYNVIINSNHKIIQKILNTEQEDEKVKVAKQAFDLALLSQGLLTGKDLSDFIQRSFQLASE